MRLRLQGNEAGLNSAFPPRRKLWHQHGGRDVESESGTLAGGVTWNSVEETTFHSVALPLPAIQVTGNSRYCGPRSIRRA